MYNHTTLRTSPLQRSGRRRTVGAEQAMKRTTLRTRAAAVAIAAALGTAACGADTEAAADTEPNQAATTVPAPLPTTTAEPTAPVTTAVPPPTTAAPDDPAPVTTEAQPDTDAEKPQVTIWSTPRLFDSTLSASWQVTPAEATCTYDLLNASGDVIGTGVADTAGSDERGRGMKVEYDPGTSDALGTVAIQCTHQGATSDPAEFQIHRITYQNRSENSVFPATDEHYFDHDEVAAMFPECRAGGRPPQSVSYTYPPPRHMVGKVDDIDGDGEFTYNDWLSQGLDFWESVFENWDTEAHDINGKTVASGWWTAEQLRMYYPSGSITPQSARQEAYYSDSADILWLEAADSYNAAANVNYDWTVAPEKVKDDDGATYYYLRDLYLRLEDSVGYVSAGDEIAGWDDEAKAVRDDGLPGNVPNPRGVRSAKLLWDWVDARYKFVPVDREPTAWAMRTLLEARSSNCIGSRMNAHCRSGDFHNSPHMRHPSQGGSRLGAVLWSTICPEISP